MAASTNRNAMAGLSERFHATRLSSAKVAAAMTMANDTAKAKPRAFCSSAMLDSATHRGRLPMVAIQVAAIRIRVDGFAALRAGDTVVLASDARSCAEDSMT